MCWKDEIGDETCLSCRVYWYGHDDFHSSFERALEKFRHCAFKLGSCFSGRGAACAITLHGEVLLMRALEMDLIKLWSTDYSSCRGVACAGVGDALDPALFIRLPFMARRSVCERWH